MEFSKRLKQLRKEKGIDRQELADYLNVSYSTIAKYEAGVRFPDKDILQKIADFFDVSIDYLMGRVNIRNQKSEVKNNHGLEDDPDLRIIERAREKMSPKDRERMMKILKASFEDFFDEDDNDEEDE